MDKFDWKFYLKYYPDLSQSQINTPQKLYQHYLNSGKYEFRYQNPQELLESHNFDANIYRYNYDDLKKLSDSELEHHFIFHGLEENRKCREYIDKEIKGKIFNLEYYRENNSDLKHMSDLEIVDHFCKYGINENRLYHPKKKVTSPKYSNKIFLDKKIDNLSSSDFKKKHREICCQELKILQKINIPNFGSELNRETVLIEFRIFPHLEFLIRNTIIKLPTWKHSVVCGEKNKFFIQDICQKICQDTDSKINIIIYEKIENPNPSFYSKMLTSKLFWNKFKSEKLLIYQEDSLLFHSQIDRFLEYDYIGAPWPISQDDNSLGVGNGGFSLRSRSKMIECLNKIHPRKLKYGKSTLNYMKNTNSVYYPEDVYFSKCMIDYGIGKVAPRNIAMDFSQETQLSKNPLGGHQFWLAPNLIKLPYIKKFIIVDDYFQKVKHRGGWNKVVNNLVEEEICHLGPITDNYITLIDCCESFFLWNNYDLKKLGKWVGIIHFVPNLPHFLNYEDISNIIENDDFKSSLGKCKMLIVLSSYLKHYLKKKFPDLNIKYIKHPIENIKTKFSIEKFIENENKCLVQLGYQSRIVSTIFRIKTKYEKIILAGRKEKNVDVFNRVKKELSYLNISDLTVKLDDIKQKYFKKNSEYDDFLTKNICIIPLWNASANNSILEIIEMNIPTFVTKMVSTIDYLGKEYPMFYNDIEEINIILEDTVKFNILLVDTYHYLKNLNKNDIRYQYFNSELLRSINT